MKNRPAANCSQCAKLQQENQTLHERMRHLEETVQQLQQQLAAAKKNSSTSSKPPSSDIVKPAKAPADPNQPKPGIGAQPGHEAHFRAAFPAEQVSKTISHRLSQCPACGSLLADTIAPPRVVQQVDLDPLTFTVEEHKNGCKPSGQRF